MITADLDQLVKVLFSVAISRLLDSAMKSSWGVSKPEASEC